jgi:hypothetical protein
VGLVHRKGQITKKKKKKREEERRSGLQVGGGFYFVLKSVPILDRNKDPVFLPKRLECGHRFSAPSLSSSPQALPLTATLISARQMSVASPRGAPSSPSL